MLENTSLIELRVEVFKLYVGRRQKGNRLLLKGAAIVFTSKSHICLKAKARVSVSSPHCRPLMIIILSSS